MLIIIIEVILAIGLYIWSGLNFYRYNKRGKIFENFHPFYNEGPSVAFILIAIVLVLTIILGSGFYLENHTNRIRYDEQCATLEFQIENNAYGDDAGLYNLNKEICKWNADIKWYREYRNNPWIGIFIPNYLGDYPIFNLVEGK